ncbi:MAG: DEAD/DEAH box helicase [Ilumatobacteraceae bacterium]
MSTFADLALRPELLAALVGLGYEEPTPIQRDAIPHLLAGADVLGQAATGTGKTAAFALPALQLVGPGRGRGPVALVLVPTRELAVQVSEATYRYGRELGARVLPIYGGQPIGRQLGALRDGVDIVVATPGRAIDHIERGTLVLDGVRLVVLDEADEMLDMGFAEDIESILGATPAERQTVLFSATMPPRINAIARRHLRDPKRIEIGPASAATGTAPLVTQRAFVVTRPHKAAALGRILDVEAPTAAIVFCRTRTEVDQLTETLNGRGYRAEALHGGMNQEGRDRVMGRLRNGTAELLIATDVAARGLDVDQLTHVINYDVPSAPDAYVHRIGRVGRAGREGVAITLAEPRELRLLGNIERVTGRPIPIEKVPTVADLRAHQIAATTATVRDALAADDLERFGPIVDELAATADVRDIAKAAVKLVHEARESGLEEIEIPEFVPRDDRAKRDRGDRGTRGDRPGPRQMSGQPGGRYQGGAKTRLFIGLGRNDRIRPGDLVGAIANESDLSGRDIGPINITDKFSTVDVPAAAADAVIAAMKQTTIRGKRPMIRRDRNQR